MSASARALILMNSRRGSSWKSCANQRFPALAAVAAKAEGTANAVNAASVNVASAVNVVSTVSGADAAGVTWVPAVGSGRISDPPARS